MLVAVEGCAHGELEIIYDTIQCIQEKQGIKVDLLICCGDFQATRNEADLRCMAVPPKYYNICSFYKYYTGEKVAPILTIFIGGNHEASNHLQELPYGGWVAPNIYYLGYAGVVNIAGLRIGGLSGIYKGRDYMKGHFEKSPYDDSSMRSVYHIRNLEVFRLKQLSGSIDIFLSHDWPSGISEYGNKNRLLKFKPFFRDDIESGQLGSKPCEELLQELKPNYWFAAHLHCKFAALVPHNDGKRTKFLALDKCLPKRKFLQILDIPHDENSKIEIEYDLEWMTILHLTNHLLSVKNVNNFMPGPSGNERFTFRPSEEEKAHVFQKMGRTLSVPKNFEKTVQGFNSESPQNKHHIKQPEAKLNAQTTLLCDMLNIDDPVSLVAEMGGISLNSSGEDSLNNSSFNESYTSIDCTPPTPVKLKTLQLPEPKVSQNDKESTSEDTIYTEESMSGVENMSPIEKSSSLIEQQLPIPKKFKRRNADMYKME